MLKQLTDGNAFWHWRKSRGGVGEAIDYRPDDVFRRSYGVRKPQGELPATVNRLPLAAAVNMAQFSKKRA